MFVATAFVDVLGVAPEHEVLIVDSLGSWLGNFSRDAEARAVAPWKNVPRRAAARDRDNRAPG